MQTAGAEQARKTTEMNRQPSRRSIASASSGYDSTRGEALGTKKSRVRRKDNIGDKSLEDKQCPSVRPVVSCIAQFSHSPESKKW